MKKYTKPAVQVVELSVKESLSALPGTFSFSKVAKTSTARFNNISIYKIDSKTGA